MKQELSELVMRFRMYGNKAYGPISSHFQPLCRNWYRHLSRRMRMDFDTFASEFEETLYNSLLKYQDNYINDAGERIPFEHYFASAVRKKVNGLKRTFMSQKRQLERKAITLSLRDHDVPDTAATYTYQHVDVLDIIFRLIDDRCSRALVILRLQGFSIEEICERLKINRREFWTRINNLRSSNRLAQVA